MKISGKVFDFKTNEPLRDASVIVEENGIPTSTGTRTNSSGQFFIDSILLDNLYNKVSFSYVGYDSVKLSPSSANTDIYLTLKGEELPAVTVWGKLKHKRGEFLIFVLSVIIATLLIIYISQMQKIKSL